MKQLSDIKKFSWGEIFNNNSGKTSSSGTAGFIICIIGSITFLLGTIDKMFISHTIDILNQSIFFVGIGASLLGVRKISDNRINISKDDDTIIPPVNP